MQLLTARTTTARTRIGAFTITLNGTDWRLRASRPTALIRPTRRIVASPFGFLLWESCDLHRLIGTVRSPATLIMKKHAHRRRCHQRGILDSIASEFFGGRRDARTAATRPG